MSILIADSGSTKTDWVLLENNKIITQVNTIGFSPYFQTSTDIGNEIKNTLLPTLNEYANPITQIFYYGTGCSNPDKINIIKQGLASAFGNVTSHVNHDLLAAARALCEKQSGIACILGTGSNSCLFDGNGITENVPSLGYLFGDYGSGAHIGKTFVQNYFDGKLPKDLNIAFENKGYNRETILDNVYKKPMPNKYLASISSFLNENISNNVVTEIIKQCFNDFFESQVCQYTNSKSLPIHSVGSIGFYYKDLLSEVAEKKGYILGNVIKSPIEGLVKYHSAYN